MFKKLMGYKKPLFGLIALLVLVVGVYSLGKEKGKENVVDEQAVTAESGMESGDVQVDVEPSPEQIEQSNEEEEAYEEEDDRTSTQKYFSLMRNVFIKYEDKFGFIVEMHSADDDTITVETDRANFVVDLVESEGYAYITNMDTAEKNRYPLPE